MLGGNRRSPHRSTAATMTAPYFSMAACFDLCRAAFLRSAPSTFARRSTERTYSSIGSPTMVTSGGFRPPTLSDDDAENGALSNDRLDVLSDYDMIPFSGTLETTMSSEETKLPAVQITTRAKATRAQNDEQMLESWLANLNSAHSRRNFEVTARRFVAELPAGGLRAATVEDVRDALARITGDVSETTGRQ